MTIGHEFVGEIVGDGSNVNDFFPGDIVSGEGHVVCGRCRNCLAGRRHLCSQTQGVGVNRRRRFCGIDCAADDEHLAARSKDQPGSGGDFRSLWQCRRIRRLSFPVHGEDVLITGAGPIGIMAIPVVRHAGARHIVVTDMNPFRLELARKMGATLAVNPTETSIADVQKQLGMQEGFDVGLEMSGNAAGVSRHDREHEPRRKDRDARHSRGKTWRSTGTVIFNMLTIKGIYGREMYETWYKMSVMLESGVDIEPIITHRFDYTEFQKGFDAMIAGQTGKVVLNWTSLA